MVTALTVLPNAENVVGPAVMATAGTTAEDDFDPPQPESIRALTAAKAEMAKRPEKYCITLCALITIFNRLPT